jgi:hypothetical protein
MVTMGWTGISDEDNKKYLIFAAKPVVKWRLR